jgi:hypothetical protein
MRPTLSRRSGAQRSVRNGSPKQPESAILIRWVIWFAEGGKSVESARV